MRVESVSASQIALPISLPRSASPSSTEAATVEPNIDAVPVFRGVPPEADLATATERLNKAAKALTSELRFSIHESTKQIVVRVVDSDGRVIREIPPERVLDAYARMLDMLGLLVDKIA